MIRKLLGLVVVLGMVAFVILKFTMPSLPPKVLLFLATYEPRAAARGFLDGAQAKDRERMKAFASEKTRDLTSAAPLIDQLADAWSVGDGMREGETARVRVRHAQDGKEFTAMLVKEHGAWRVDLLATAAENTGLPELFRGLTK